MKKQMYKYLALLFLVVLTLQTVTGDKTMIVKAATEPTLSLSSKTVVGVGAGFTLQLVDVDMTTVKRATWYTQDEAVATVDKTGNVTSTGKGTTKIKCKITYKDGSVKRPACKVTVKIPATGIDISNTVDYEVNNSHVIALGETYNFNRNLTPSNASDKTYWVIDNEDYATVNSSGIVTPIKTGSIRLTAIASITADGVATSYVRDTINITIVEKTANVSSILLTDSTNLNITFSNPMDSSTILNSAGKLLDAISITAKTDTKGIVASSLGTISGSLSTDGTVLTITSTNAFNGLYGIHFSSDIKTLDKVSLVEQYETMELYDTVPPRFTNYTVDDTGLKVTINFSEPMDFTGLAITEVRAINSTNTILPITVTMLSDTANYIVAEDKQSLSIDLTSMSSTDYNKMFLVSMSNIKDIAGNYPTNYPLTVYFATDTTAKAQAQLVSLVRTGYSTLTATFSRAIQSPGMLMLSNNEWISGVVDENDTKKVNYTLSTASSLLTGIQTVSLGYWNSYNVISTDTSASSLITRTIDFTIDNTVPQLLDSELALVTENGITSHVLTLTYSKNVNVAASGSFSAKLVTLNNDIYSNRIIGYTATAKNAIVTIVLTSSQFTDNGTYNLSIPAGFVVDNYANKSISTTVAVQKNSSTSTSLPAPKEIVQSTESNSIIYVVFGNKIDNESAQNVANYTITGVKISSAEVIDNTSSGATVKLTLAVGSLTSTTVYPITISGITGYNGSYTAMATYQTVVALKENVSAYLVSSLYTYPLTLTLTFNENISGTANFQVIYNNTDIVSSSVIVDNTVVITLKTIPTQNTVLQIVPTATNSILDTNGNTSTIATRYVVASYN